MMKKNYLFLLLLCLITTSQYAQITFEEIQVAFGSSDLRSQSNFLADIDGDGDLDAVANILGSDLMWFENMDGIGTFGYERLITETTINGGYMYPVDIDSDGDIDILSVTAINSVIWVENTDGLGTFGEEHVINSDLPNAYAVHFGDLDGDGDIDVVSANYASGEGRLSWYENSDGQGTFTNEQVITTLSYNLPSIFCEDVDNDGDLDIFVSKGNIVWFENLDGNATFSSQIVIGNPYSSSGYYDLLPTDLDQDGDVDLIVPNGYDDDVIWYENFNGNGFSDEQYIAVLSYDIGTCAAGDFDGDNDIDVLTDYQFINLRLNNGSENFSNGGTIGDVDLQGAWNIEVGDVDNDGDLDVLSGTYHNLGLFWLKNDGMANFTANPITHKTVTPKSSEFSDIDNDGDLDIVVGSTFGTYWFENMDGNIDYGIQHWIIYSEPVDFIFVHDLNGDNYQDVVGFKENGNELFWMQNLDGEGNFGPKTIISTSCDRPTMARVYDIDSDGDLDILLSSKNDNKVAWYYNQDGQGNFGSEQVVTTTATGAEDVRIADMDGDGDEDIVVGAAGMNSILWYENQGSGNFNTEHTVTNDCLTVKSLDVKDIDADGDLDILASSSGNYNFSWYENLDGNGVFGEATSISTDMNNSRRVSLNDVDNDGDVDAIAINNNGTLRWFENENGLGGFNVNGDVIGGTGSNSPNLYVADFDFDGDVDIMASSISNYYSRLHIYKNLGFLGNEINGTVFIDIDGNGCQVTDPILEGALVSTTNGADSFSAFTDIDGSFQIPVSIGEYVTTLEGNYPYYSVSPSSANTTLTNEGDIENINFCLTPNASINDLNIVIIPMQSPRPGFSVQYKILFKNVGTNPMDGSVSFEYNDQKLEFVSSDQTVSSQTANTLNFDFEGLNPFEERTIMLYFQVFPPPTTNINDELFAVATVNPIPDDNTEYDNIFQLQQTVIGSYDPNDITCLQGDEVLIEDADKYLHYVIRFQNTGTAEAINVRVEQTLDDKLDWTTMQIEDLSHRGNISIENGTEFTASFSHINLPSSNQNEPESHGYIVYKVKPKNTVNLGDIVYATADIYFDYNPPIITNTAETEFVASLSVPEYQINKVVIYPNPVENILHVNPMGQATINTVSLIDINGRTLLSKPINSSQAQQMDMSVYQKGIYFLLIDSDAGTETFKLIVR